MTEQIRLRKGLDIKLKGRAKKQTMPLESSKLYAIVPDDFVGVTPKMAVKAGDHVKAGETLFVNKNSEEVRFASPVSGTVKSIERGDRRKILYVSVEADDEQTFADFGAKDIQTLDGEGVKKALLEAGLFGHINQLPYAVSTTPDTEPKAIFVSALRDKPLQGDFEYELEGQEQAFQTGLTALSKIAKVYLSIGAQQNCKALTEAKNVELTVFDGSCPAGNVGVQVNHLSPVNKGEVVWTVDPTAVIFFGRLFQTGKVDLTRVVAVAGSKVKEPAYVKALVGTPIKDIVAGRLTATEHVRILNGNPLTGTIAGDNAFLGAHTSEVVAMPEGDDVDEMAGWIMPRFNQFSTSRSYFSWLFGNKKEYDLDARIKGGKRNIIMSGEYDSVLPMDIYGEYLIKAIITGNIDKQEQLGIYEVSPEDFALAEFVDSSKQPLQQIVRNGLNTLRKENE
ncbi:NADH:ubiquinone reductase (Na(+)-transporting) subunit A [Prevotella intermedia]|uniref:Na(+)-translocating NADH-quinone reductase subunit A n=1 Tax=Prevotella intermedia TaxID=28131 RepID=A0AAJ3RQL3_PREIN|nr:Na(+)-translocating NADH-quinone reductase subunit A [Prevotella intermedia]ATV55647.1 NADH:ubiquinone reductase (Na(+)-transporting) subunit A [Prevotella intermedia]PJI19161.1 NADH:ubiquinone reductase (Na(+)-transporting) subunit A [Prevotella intermedia]